MRHFLLSMLFLVCFGWCWPDNANCGGEPDESHFYIEPKCSWYSIDLPGYAPIALRSGLDLVARLETIDRDPEGALPELTLGWAGPTSLLPENPLVFELQGFDVSFSDSQTKLFDYSAAYRVGWYELNGQQPGVGFGGGDDVATSSRRKVDYQGGEVRVGVVFPLEDGITVSPFAGFALMALDQDYRTNAYEVQDPRNWMLLDEELSSNYQGPLLGTRLRFSQDRFEAMLSGSVAWFELKTDYEGYQEETIIPYTAARRDSDRRQTSRIRLGLDLAYRFEHWKIGLSGGVERLGHVAKVVASDKGTVGSTRYGSPTRIDYDSSISWKVGPFLTIWF